MLVQELLELLQSVKDTEKKDERGPYEDESQDVLEARLKELLGSYTITSLLTKPTVEVGHGPGEHPTTSEGALVTDSITPLPSGPVQPAELPPVGEVGLEVLGGPDGGGLSIGPLDEVNPFLQEHVEPAPLRMMLT